MRSFKTGFGLFLLLASAWAKDDYFRNIIDFVNKGDFSWKALDSDVTALGRGSHNLVGAHLTPASERSLSSKPCVTVDHSTLPEAFDSRNQWPNCPDIWSIKDQGNCGTCWAVSSSSVMSDRLCIASGGQIQVNISAENLAACCTDCGLGCNGGYPDKAWPYFLETGLVTGGDYKSGEGCQPYEVAPSGSPTQESSSSNQYLICNRKKCTNKKYTTSYKQDLHYGKTAYYLPNDATSIQAEIMTNGPVVAGFTVYDDFMTYSSGVYQHVTGGVAGGHAVRILGWGVDQGLDYWLVANSWNRAWGEDGYFRIIRGVNECGIEEFITAGLADS